MNHVNCMQRSHFFFRLGDSWHSRTIKIAHGWVQQLTLGSLVSCDRTSLSLRLWNQPELTPVGWSEASGLAHTCRQTLVGCSKCCIQSCLIRPFPIVLDIDVYTSPMASREAESCVLLTRDVKWPSWLLNQWCLFVHNLLAWHVRRIIFYVILSD